MKHHNDFYLQLTRELFTDKYRDISHGAKWLFVVLNDLEQRYTDNDVDYFFRTDAELADDAGLSLSTVKRYKAELKRSGLVEIWTTHLIGQRGIRTERQRTCYRLLI